MFTCVGIWVFTTALERFFSRNGNLLHHSNDTIQKISQTSTSSPSSFFIRCTFFTFTTTQPSITECLMIELDFRRIYEGILFVLLLNFLIQNTSIWWKSFFFFLKCMAPPSTNAKLLHPFFIQDQKYRVTRTQKTKIWFWNSR